MTIKTLAELKAKFETGDRPTAADFVDLIDSFLHAQLGNFPNPLPAVSGAALLNIGSALPDPLPARDGSALTNINPQEYNTPAGMPTPSYATATTFVLTGDWTIGSAILAQRVFLVTRRLELTIAAVPFYTDVNTASFAAGITTVTTLDAMPSNQLTAVKVGVIRPFSKGGAVGPRLLGISPNSPGYGTIWSHHAVDVTNDWNISAGGCMDATATYWMSTAAVIGKQADVAWAVGGTAAAPLGMLDTGAVANADYYIWMIARSDTGVVDFLSSLSSTAPTMPTGYDFKRLRGWFKRVAGVNVLMDVYETEGGGVDVAWRVPTEDVTTANTLTTSRRTDAVKVPLNFSVIANMTVRMNDTATAFNARVTCPDETDAAVTAVFSNFYGAAGSPQNKNIIVRTSATGLIAARSDLATVDSYTIITNGFSWARRN